MLILNSLLQVIICLLKGACGVRTAKISTESKRIAGKMLIEGVDVSTLNDNQLADLRRNVAQLLV